MIKDGTRVSGRKNTQLRPITIETSVLNHAEGSCLIKCGNTHIICSATFENNVPRFLKGQNHGWITAEYGMLPRCTAERIKREAKSGKVSGRTQEIERLIGRALRAAVNLKALGERQIVIDCDVINADGGTRTAAITGSYVALHLAISKLMSKRTLSINPLLAQVAAISCGIYNNQTMIDLDYSEDSDAEVDANFVFNSDGKIIEIQAAAEKNAFTTEQLSSMITLAQSNVMELFKIQNKALLNIS